MPALTKDQIKTLATAVNPINGIVGGVRTLMAPDHSNPWFIEVSSVGRPKYFAPDVYDETPEPASISGAGGSMDQEQARGLAIVEGIERYASCVFDPAEVEVLTWRDAASRGAFHWSEFPRLSASEVSHSACPISPPNPDLPLRWVKATDLSTGERSLLPLVMTHLHVRYRLPGERIWLPISTGVAAHSSDSAAIASGLIEVIERDAITLVWNHELPLRSIDPSGEPAVVKVLEMARRGGREIMLFNASLDHQVPIVYCVDRCHSSQLQTVVSCAADLSFSSAALKALREATSCRVALENTPPRTNEVDDFIGVFDGAVYMGQAEQAGAFGFLEGGGEQPFEPDWFRSIGTPGSQLIDSLVADVRERTGSSVFATELTTVECRHLGLVVWRVIAPGLQPLSFSPRAQYREHPRNSIGPRNAGFAAKSEGNQNVHPQPFA